MARIIMALSGIAFLLVGSVLTVLRGVELLPILFFVVGLGDLAVAVVLSLKKV